MKQRKKSAVLPTGSKKTLFHVGMYSGVYESIWFKIDTMIDTIELYILILVQVTLALI